MQVLKKPTIIETIRLNRLRWLRHVQRVEENRTPKRVLYVGNSISKLQIQVTTYVFELSAGNCHR